MPVETPSPARRLRLSSHVRACHSNGQVILLDMRRNRYLGIGGRPARALADVVQDWPAVSEPEEPCVASLAVDALARRLISQGLLTDRSAARLPDPAIDEAISSLDFETVGAESHIGARRVYAFLRSTAVAAAWLRYRSLHSIARAVASRRERLRVLATDPDSLDGMRGAAAAYDQLRPFVFTAQDRCLHDSLALVGFMASQGFGPRWVVGVKTGPFAAHSWVQCGGAVLNDQHDHVRRYAPILVV